MNLRSLPFSLAAFAMSICSSQAQTVAPFDQALYSKPGQMVEVAPGRRLNLVCQGSGSPAVLMEAGFGESSVTWRYVQSEIAKATRTCAYDRAGLGFSDPSGEPQNLENMVEDLNALVKAGNIGQPFILVAHSMGGMNAVYYADKHLSDLAGMVLVDPAVANQERELARVTDSYYAANAKQRGMIVKCLDAAKAGDIKPDSAMLGDCANVTPGANADLAAVQNGWATKASYFEALLSEHKNMFRLREEVPTADDLQLNAQQRSFGALPLIVLTAGDGMPGLQGEEKVATDALWMKLHDALAARSSVGTNRLVPKSGHYIQEDNPPAVISAVMDVLASARKNGTVSR